MRAPGRIRSSWTAYAPPVSFPNNALNVTRIPDTQRLIPSPEFKHRSWVQVTNWSMKLWRLGSSGQISNTLKEEIIFFFYNLADWQALLRFPRGFVSAQMCNAYEGILRLVAWRCGLIGTTWNFASLLFFQTLMVRKKRSRPRQCWFFTCYKWH
jgi:hypothetical protein